MLEQIVDYLLCALIDAGHTTACAIQSIGSRTRLCRGERVGLGRCKGFALHRSAPFQALDACACPAVPLVMLAPGVWQVHQAARHISGPISGTYGQRMPQWAHSSALIHLPMVYQHRPASQSVWLGPGVCIRASILQTGQIVKTIVQHSAQALAYINKAIGELAQLTRDPAIKTSNMDISDGCVGNADRPDREDSCTAPSSGVGIIQQGHQEACSADHRPRTQGSHHGRQ